MLCGACTAESIEDRASFPSAVKSKPKPTKKKAQKAIDEGMYKPVTTLQQSCLTVNLRLSSLPLPPSRTDGMESLSSRSLVNISTT